MVAIKAVAHFSNPVSDIARSTRFYTEIVGCKHLVLCRIERRPPKLDLTLYPYLPRARVATTSAKAYMGLLGGAAS